MTMRRLATLTLLTAGVALGIASPALATPSVYYKNCAEARAAGAAPINRGEPGYRAGLDRDKDGVACEDTASTPSNPGAQPAGSNTGTVATPGQQAASLPNTGTSIPLPLLIGTGGALVLGGVGLVRSGVVRRIGRHRA